MASSLGMATFWQPSRSAWNVPCLRMSELSDTDKRAYVLADNKLAANAGWDKELLAIELQGLVDVDYQIELTGFSIGETDMAIQIGKTQPLPATICQKMPFLSQKKIPRRRDRETSGNLGTIG